MINFFLMQIRLGKIKIDDVPALFRSAVLEKLKDEQV